MKKKISVILSFYDEEAVLPAFLQRLKTVFDKLDFDSEFIFVNDASQDKSLEILRSEAKTDSRIKVINMSRQFGCYPCFFAGFRRAGGDAVITMDVDLQDPPELIPLMIQKWLEGFDVVYTVRSRRYGESFLKLALMKVGYHLLNWFSEGRIPINAGDFRLMSKRVVRELSNLAEDKPYLRGIVPWLGFKQDFVTYERAPRAAGRSHMPIFTGLKIPFPFRSLIDGISSFSVVPLYFASFLGILLMGAAFFGFLFFSIPFVYLCLLIFGGIQLLGIGILGFYLGRVYLELKGRPNYIIESEIGFED